MIISNAIEQAWLDQFSDFVTDLEVKAAKGRALLDLYRKQVTTKSFPLKQVISEAASTAPDSNESEAILRAIASRVYDVDRHIQDDTTIYEDIRAWLLYEASLEQSK